MSPRTGRPTIDPKENQYKIRLSNSELEMLNYCCKVAGLSKADVIRQGIQEVYKKVQKK